MEILQYPLAFLLLLGVIVVFHEFGHFIVARRSGVHVVRFSVGFGKPLLRWSDKYGTEFALSAIPLGGYVSMITNKLIEIDPESVKDLTEEQLKNTFDSMIKKTGHVNAYFPLFITKSLISFGNSSKCRHSIFKIDDKHLFVHFFFCVNTP